MQLWHGAYHSLDYDWILRHNSGLCLRPADACHVKLGLDVDNQTHSHLLTLLMFCLTPADTDIRMDQVTFLAGCKWYN